MSVKKRKYLEIYLKLEFTFTKNNGLDIPVCVYSQKSLGNNLMKPSLFTRHLQKAHPEFKDKNLDFFKHRESVFKKQRLDKGHMFFPQTNASLKASSEVSFIIAKQKKSTYREKPGPTCSNTNGKSCLWRRISGKTYLSV